MKKNFFLFILSMFACFFFNVSFAQDVEDVNNADLVVQNKNVTIEKEQEIEAFLLKHQTLQNKHNLLALKKLYADEFVNADGFNKYQLFELMKKTFESYPNIKISSNIDNVYVNGDFAIVHMSQVVSATTKEVSKITNDNGVYSANLKTVLYLKKIGKNWEIYSEDVISEVSKLAYGAAKSANAYIYAPNKVLAGSDYCAGVKVAILDGYSSIASINSTQIVDGYNLDGEVFRQISSSSNDLERILKANNKNNNEAVVVSLGFTKINQGMFKKKKIDIEGLLLLMQRVDVIPINSNLEMQNVRSQN